MANPHSKKFKSEDNDPNNIHSENKYSTENYVYKAYEISELVFLSELNKIKKIVGI